MARGGLLVWLGTAVTCGAQRRRRAQGWPMSRMSVFSLRGDDRSDQAM